MVLNGHFKLASNSSTAEQLKSEKQRTINLFLFSVPKLNMYVYICEALLAAALFIILISFSNKALFTWYYKNR